MALAPITSITLVISPIDLATICVQTDAAYASIKKGPRCYLDENFALHAVAPTVDPNQIVNRVRALYALSIEGDKDTKAKKILVTIGLLYANTPGLAAKVKAVLADLPQIKAKTDLYRKRILLLLQIKKMFSCFNSYITIGSEAVQKEELINKFRKLKIVVRRDIRIAEASYVLKEEASIEEWREMALTAEGCACMAKLPIRKTMTSSGWTYSISPLDMSPEDRLLLQSYTASSACPEKHFTRGISQYLEFLDVQKRFTRAKETLENSIQVCCESMDELAFFNQELPSAGVLVRQYITNDPLPETPPHFGYTFNRDFYEHLRKLHKNCEDFAVNNREALITKYRQITDELWDLDVVLPASCEEYAHEAFNLAPFASRFPPLLNPAKPPENAPVTVTQIPARRRKKAAHKKSAASHISSPSAAANKKDRSTLEEKKETKEKKEAEAPYEERLPPTPSPSPLATARVPKTVLTDDCSSFTTAASTSSTRVTPHSCPRSLSTLVPNPKSIFMTLQYDERVLLWKTPDVALEKLGYSELPEHVQRTQVGNHAFTQHVDRFLGSQLGAEYIHQSEWDNPTTGRKDTLLSVVAEVERGGRKHRGVITFCIDNEGVCYHRYFGTKAHNDFVDMILSKQVRTESEFPSLQVSYDLHAAKSKTKIVRLAPSDTSGGIDMDLMGMATIQDPENDQIIRLFKMRGKNPPA